MSRHRHAALFAYDRGTVRSYDADGRLHVAVANLSKAMVCPYLGSEIPGADELGLDPRRTYQLYRDPDEIAAAVRTFNNLPLLSEHVPVSAAVPRSDLIVGSTGTDAAFVFPYLQNSLVVWSGDAIEGIETLAKVELSAAYRYDFDPTPGRTPAGDFFDGVMRRLVGNHIALVETGRSGPDVVVGDAALQTAEQRFLRTYPDAARIGRSC